MPTCERPVQSTYHISYPSCAAYISCLQHPKSTLLEMVCFSCRTGQLFCSWACQCILPSNSHCGSSSVFRICRIHLDRLPPHLLLTLQRKRSYQLTNFPLQPLKNRGYLLGEFLMTVKRATLLCPVLIISYSHTPGYEPGSIAGFLGQGKSSGFGGFTGIQSW